MVKFRRNMPSSDAADGALVLVALVVLLAAAAGIGVLLRPGSGSESPRRTAAIVDQLSLTAPNGAFVDAASGLLQDAGYSVTYYPGEQVTVDLYRDLPARNYDLIILRVHSAPVMDNESRLRLEPESRRA